MTAEIAILNKSAIALAADSKVTLSIAGRQKTYDTVNKLFSLSKTEPVGAMVYGNAEFMGFPWETILKEYRRRKPTKRFDTVFDWADDILAFLKDFFPFAHEDGANISHMIGATAVSGIFDRYIEALQEGAPTEEVAVILQQEIDLHIHNLENAPDFLSDEEWRGLENGHHQVVEELANSGIGETFEDLRPALRRLVELTIRKQISSPIYSGLVVAGFGEKELLPSLVAFQIDGIIGGKLKCTRSTRFDSTRQSQGLIQPFAQTDMVYRFMEGIDPNYAVQLRANIEALIRQNSLDTLAALGVPDGDIEAMAPAIEKAASASLEAFWKEDARIRWEQFAEPIIDMAMSLPKDELANLAESLVSLTSLQRRVSREIETVGGAIDVAVISKGDGFVWVKRKHYFNADRNLRFVQGYFSEYGTSKSDGEEDGNA